MAGIAGDTVWYGTLRNSTRAGPWGSLSLVRMISKVQCPLDATMVETEYCQKWRFQDIFSSNSMKSAPDAIHGKEPTPRDLRRFAAQRWAMASC